MSTCCVLRLVLGSAGDTVVTGSDFTGQRGIQPRVNRIRVREPDAVKEGFLEEGTPSSLQSL